MNFLFRQWSDPILNLLNITNTFFAAYLLDIVRLKISSKKNLQFYVERGLTRDKTFRISREQ